MAWTAVVPAGNGYLQDYSKVEPSSGKAFEYTRLEYTLLLSHNQDDTFLLTFLFQSRCSRITRYIGKQ